MESYTTFKDYQVQHINDVYLFQTDLQGFMSFPPKSQQDFL